MTTGKSAAPAAASSPQAKRPTHAPVQLGWARVLSQSEREARRRAAAVLEVLAGSRSPTDAARALGVTPNRYYLLELRAVQGLVRGCGTEDGRRRPLEQETGRLRKQVAKLERECARYAALARIARQAVALSPPAASASGKTADGKRKRRRPQLRALKLAARLAPAAAENNPATPASAPPSPGAPSG